MSCAEESCQFLGQVPKYRTDLLPHYSRLVAVLNRYMPDIGTDLLAVVRARISCKVAPTQPTSSSKKNFAIFRRRRMSFGS